VVKIFPKHDTSIQLGKFEKELDSKLAVYVNMQTRCTWYSK